MWTVGKECPTTEFLYLVLENFFCYTMNFRKGNMRSNVRSPRPIQGKCWWNLKISWAVMVAMFILSWGFMNLKVIVRQSIFGNECRWCHWSSKENGNLWALMGYGKQMLQYPISCSSLFNFQWELYDGNGVSIKNWVFIVENELPHPWIVGSWKEIMSDLIPWNPCLCVTFYE